MGDERVASRLVSDLLPNLHVLLDYLSDTTTARRDAHALAEAVQDAGSVAEIDEALAAVVAGWREQ